MRNCLTIILVLLLSACSAKDLYQANQSSQKSRCDHHVGYEKEQCLQDVDNTSYDEYEKTRQAIIHKKQSKQ